MIDYRVNPFAGRRFPFPARSTVLEPTTSATVPPVPDPDRPVDPEPPPNPVPDPDRPVEPAPTPYPLPDPDRPIGPDPDRPVTPEPEPAPGL
ncbi:MAG TPA: hypothetical protein VL551_29920 [Actinospica sp.]|jgi:hypothetical protein|nr:hypothetical protein [Actinospica sp.]